MMGDKIFFNFFLMLAIWVRTFSIYFFGYKFILITPPELQCYFIFYLKSFVLSKNSLHLDYMGNVC